MPWFENSNTVAQNLSEIETTDDLERLQVANSALETAAPKTSATERLRLATAHERLGRRIDAARQTDLLNAGGRDGQQAAWFALNSGAYWRAARVARAAVESVAPEPTMRLLWKAICAAIASNSSVRCVGDS